MFDEKADVGFLKMGIYGVGGSGKTRTATNVAIGLAKHVAANGHPQPRVLFLDTERGAHWVKPLFDAAGVKLGVSETRSFLDLKEAVKIADAENAILIVDSISHFWVEIQRAFLESRSRGGSKKIRMEFQDFGVIKPMWQEFTDMFLNSRAHVILCGRSASIYDYQENDSGKKELITVGTRLGAEKGMSYEPSLNVEMYFVHAPAARGKKKIENWAIVMKDRSDAINGQTFKNPTFATFLPHIKRLNIGGEEGGVDLSRSSKAAIPREEWDERSFAKKVALDEIGDLLVSQFGNTAVAKKSKVDAINEAFGCTWRVVEKMGLEEVQAGYDALYRKFKGEPSKYAVPELDDEIPGEGAGSAEADRS